MKQWHLPYAFGILLVMIAVFVLAIIPAVEKSPVEYKGKEVFRTESEYSQFKEVVGQKEVQIQSVTVLSSSPPIVTTFSVFVPYDMDFGYGERTGNTDDVVCVGIAFFMLGWFIIGWVPVIITWELL